MYFVHKEETAVPLKRDETFASIKLLGKEIKAIGGFGYFFSRNIDGVGVEIDYSEIKSSGKRFTATFFNAGAFKTNGIDLAPMSLFKGTLEMGAIAKPGFALHFIVGVKTGDLELNLRKLNY